MSESQENSNLMEEDDWECKTTVIHSYSNNEYLGYTVHITGQIGLEELNGTKKVYVHKFQSFDTHWTLEMYPYGRNDESKDYVSLIFKLISKRDESPLSVNFTMDYTKKELYTRNFSMSKNRTWGWNKWKKRDGSNFEINAVLRSVHTVKEPTCLVCIPWKEFNLTELLFNKIPDIEIRGKDYKVYSHRDILQQVSMFFQSMFQHEMKENLENFIEMPEFTQDAVNAMLYFIYTGRIEKTTFELLVELVKLSDMYKLDLLKVCSDQQLSLYISTERVCDITILSNLYSLTICNSLCLEFIKNNYKEVLDSEGWERLSKHSDSVLCVTRSMSHLFVNDNN